MLKFRVLGFAVCIIIFFLTCMANGQKKHPLAKAYLTINNNSAIVQEDTLFENKLRIKLAKSLKMKGFLLVPNDEIETMGKPSLYINIDISDSLRINAKKSIADQGIASITTLPKIKSYKYKDETAIMNYAVQFVKKYL
jgi:hypothetical protein